MRDAQNTMRRMLKNYDWQALSIVYQLLNIEKNIELRFLFGEKTIQINSAHTKAIDAPARLKLAEICPPACPPACTSYSVANARAAVNHLATTTT